MSLKEEEFQTIDGLLIDCRPTCYVCDLRINVEIEKVKTTRRVGGKEVLEEKVIEVEPLCVGVDRGGNKIYRHRGYISPKCEPDSDYYIRKFKDSMSEDIRNALVNGKEKEKEKRMKKDAGVVGVDKEVMEKAKVKLFAFNKQLADAYDTKKEKLVNAYKGKIAKTITELDVASVFKVDENGYAVQTAPAQKEKAKAKEQEKGVKEPKEKKEKAEKVERECGCGCGGSTSSYFVPGHDGRVKGMFKKLEKGEEKASSMTPSVQELYKLHVAFPEVSLRDLAIMKEEKNNKKKK